MVSQLALLGGNPVRTSPFHSWPVFDKKDETAFIETMRSGRWGKMDGVQAKAFEQRFAQVHHAKHGIAVVNGTVALRIALWAAGVGPGDEVLVPPFTFIATASSVIEANAVPVFVDIEPETLNIDPYKIEAAITDRTRAIIPVHFAGLAVDMDRIMDIASRHDLVVIEDACHAHGAEYKGRRLGSIGDLGCFSFQSSKNLTAGEGGIIISNNDELAGKCWSIHNCGRLPGKMWYEHFNLGANYRLGEFQGAILNTQLDRLEDQCRLRRTNALYLSEKLRGIAGLNLQQYDVESVKHSYHLFTIRYEKEKFGLAPDIFLKAVNAEGIPLAKAYPTPIYQQPYFQQRNFGPYGAAFSDPAKYDYTACSCPVTEKVCSEEGFWLIHHIFLGSQQDMDDIAAAFEKVYVHRDELIENATKIQN